MAVQEVLLSNPRILKELSIVRKICGFESHASLRYFAQAEDTTSKSYAKVNQICLEILSMFKETDENSTWED